MMDLIFLFACQLSLSQPGMVNICINFPAADQFQCWKLIVSVFKLYISVYSFNGMWKVLRKNLAVFPWAVFAGSQWPQVHVSVSLCLHKGLSNSAIEETESKHSSGVNAVWGNPPSSQLIVHRLLQLSQGGKKHPFVHFTWVIWTYIIKHKDLTTA